MKSIEKSTTIKSILSINKPCQFPELFANVLYAEGLGRFANRGIGYGSAVLDHVKERGATSTAIRCIVGPITGRESVCKGELAKVIKWTAVIFDKPRRELRARRTERLGIQRVGRRLLGGQIFDRDKAGSRRERGNSELDVVSSRYSDG